MNANPTFNRRSFLTATAAAGASAYFGRSFPLGRPNVMDSAGKNVRRSANDEIHVAVIGTGVRGKYLVGNLPDDVRVVALCDCSLHQIHETVEPDTTFAPVLDRFVERDAGRCAIYQDYRVLLDTQRLDAVIVATPDHHHAQIALLAMQAGLDVYLEKPMTVTVSEGRAIVDMVESTGAVLQVGSQQRTMEFNQFACEFIRDGGLGRIARVELPNYPGPISDPSFPAASVPDGMDWDMFLGPTPARAYHRQLWMKDAFEVDGLVWRGWDLFEDYSGHLMTNWGAHSIDMVQYALGMDHSGPVQVDLQDELDTSAMESDWEEKWSAKTPPKIGEWAQAQRFQPVEMIYANGTTLHFTPGVDVAIFHGEEGRMFIRRNAYRTDPPDLITDGPDPALAENWSGAGHVARPHLQNWLDCLATRNTPNAPAHVGHRTATICHLANLARKLQRSFQWDPETEQSDSEEVNRHLSRPRREGFELPG